MKKFKSVVFATVTLLATCVLSSCSFGPSYLVIPHSVSSASAVTVDNLNLAKGDYEVLNTITESASVLCEYKKNQIRISGDSGAFAYIFTLDKKGFWKLSSFQGAASLGYFTSDLTNSMQNIPDGEEFARRVAISRIIRAAKDYHADGIVEPVVISSANNVGNNKIEYISTVSAKLISIKTTR